VHAVEAVPAPPVAIGRPIANTEVHLLDGALQPVPLGAAGGLWIGGTGLARGYRGRPDLTAERFLPDPFGRAPGARLYRTGDACRRLADGRLDFLGRSDDQLKVRGFRVEAGEVEAALMAQPGVGQAVVVARAEPEGARLVAFLVPAAGAAADPPLDAGALRAALRATLPEYMVPSTLVELASLPLTVNGKVDRRALAALETERTLRRAAPPVPARTATERAVFAIWSAVLGRSDFGVEDDFFDLGGHSLLATRVASRLRRELAVALPMRDLLTTPTVAALAERVEEALLAEAGDESLDRLLAEMEQEDGAAPIAVGAAVAVAVGAGAGRGGEESR